MGVAYTVEELSQSSHDAPAHTETFDFNTDSFATKLNGQSVTSSNGVVASGSGVIGTSQSHGSITGTQSTEQFTNKIGDGYWL